MSGPNPWVNPPSGRNAQTFDNPTFTGNVTGAQRLLFQWAIPFIHISSGSVGNNGALTGVTALPTTYSGGAWVLFPAGAIATGVPAAAAWLWVVFSSTTAGTVYNSTYSSGLPAAGTQTAFATTGPGAFTGSTTQTTGPSLTIPGNIMGANGFLRVSLTGACTNNANSKNLLIRDLGGASSFISASLASLPQGGHEGLIMNRGVTNKQVNIGSVSTGLPNNNVPTYSSVDTTGSSTLIYQLSKGTATDNLILEGGAVYVQYGA